MKIAITTQNITTASNIVRLPRCPKRFFPRTSRAENNIERILYLGSLHIARVRIDRVRFPILLVVSSTTKKEITSLSPFAPENLVSRDGLGRVSSRVSLPILYTQAESGGFTHGIPLDFRGGVHSFT